MATQVGPRYPTSYSDSPAGNKSGTDAAWLNPTNIYAADGSTASGQEVSGGDYTNVLGAGGFDFSTVPDDAVVSGLLVEINISGYSSAEFGLFASTSNKSTSNMMTGAGVPSTAITVPYGGSTNDWGAGFTGADLKDPSFGLSMQWVNTHGGGQVDVDFVRVTVWWQPAPKPQDIHQNKYHIYKAYNSAKQYLGIVPGVSNPFSVSQDINSAGGQITMEVAQATDTAALQAVEVITDESGDPWTDESGEAITTEGAPNLVALGEGDALIKNGNIIVVWEYSYYWPNGHIVFRGKIEHWEAPNGGGDDDNITVYVYADGQDLNNYLITGSPFTYTLDQSQTVQNASATISNTSDNATTYNYYGQTWTVGGTAATNVGAISLYLNGTANVTINIYDGPGMLNLLATTSKAVSVSTATEVQFTLANHILTTGGTQLFYTVSVDANQSITIYYNTANPYAGGDMYNANFSGTSGGGYTLQTGYDLYFKTFSSDGSTTATFTNEDPTNGMLKTFMGDYNQRGGLITYTDSTIDATGLSLTYEFNTDAVAYGLDAVLSIAPAGFYYFVDYGTNLLYFKQASTTADITLVKGLHIKDVNVVATIENVKNSVAFIGGKPSGSTTNLYKTGQDATSISRYGQRLQVLSDNHVTDSGTASAVISTYLDNNKSEKYATVVTVLDKTIDTSMLRVGMMIGFSGFGNFVDSMLLQVVRVDYNRDWCKLTLGAMQKRQGRDLEQVTRQLTALQTIDNPSSPS